MKKLIITFVICLCATAVFAQGHHRRGGGGHHGGGPRSSYYGGYHYHHHGNSGVRLAADIVGLVGESIGVVRNLTAPVVYTAPVYATPTYTTPVTPVYTTPVYTAPVYTTPAYQVQPTIYDYSQYRPW